MKQADRELQLFLRSLTSSEAAEWIISKADDLKRDLVDVRHLLKAHSWKKQDQMKLANCFLNNLPHASSGYYESFLSFMSLSSFIGVIKENLPNSIEDKRLVRYHLEPLLKKRSCSDKEQHLVKEFLLLLT